MLNLKNHLKKERLRGHPITLFNAVGHKCSSLQSIALLQTQNSIKFDRALHFSIVFNSQPTHRTYHWWPPESVQRHFEGLFFKASSLKDGGPMIMSTSLGRDEFDNHSIIDRLKQTVEFRFFALCCRSKCG